MSSVQGQRIGACGLLWMTGVGWEEEASETPRRLMEVAGGGTWIRKNTLQDFDQGMA